MSISTGAAIYQMECPNSNKTFGHQKYLPRQDKITNENLAIKSSTYFSSSKSNLHKIEIIITTWTRSTVSTFDNNIINITSPGLLPYYYCPYKYINLISLQMCLDERASKHQLSHVMFRQQKLGNVRDKTR